MVTSDDISIVLSGGVSNTNPNNSLGGDPSPNLVGTNLNNLFSDVSSDDAASGIVDYRCIYIFNDNSTDSLYNVNVVVSTQSDPGSFIDLGVLSRNEVQTLMVVGSPTGGTIRLFLDGIETTDIAYNTDIGIFSLNVESALSDISSGIGADGDVDTGLVTITFGFDSGNRNFPSITVSDNSLTPTVSDPVIDVVTEGGPVNDIAADIEIATVTPNMVEFTSDPIVIGTLKPEDGFPLWVRRSTTAGSDELADDTFTLVLQGSLLP